ncbi:MAG: hypothetical protein AABX31_01455 [Nanoarchaeota archaeon]
MSATTLDDLTHSEIILNLVLLKPGERNFRIEDFARGLRAVSGENPRLRISNNAIDDTFFFYDHYLHGEWDLPHYRLSREGRRDLQKEFNTYSAELQHKLTELAEKVWQYE